MQESKLPKKTSEKISRSLSIMFNRASMYDMDHPFTIQAIRDLYRTLSDSLDIFSPIALHRNRDQFYVEEEPFDHRLNTSKMLDRFKRTGIQSISFEKGLKEDELQTALRIYADQRKYSSAVSIKNGLVGKSIANIKINHVIYKKMTEDEIVVSRENLKGDSEETRNNSSTQMYGEVVNMMAESILMEELEKSVSLENLLADPGKLSRDLIDKDLSLSENSKSEPGKNGLVIVDQLQEIRKELDGVAQKTDKVDLSELADAVFDLKKQLIAGIESQKSLGVIYENEKEVIDEANELADQVLIRIVKEEYRNGEISVQRLAQIIGRLIPESDELKRLLPKLSEAMLEEGMSKDDFLQLMRALNKELSSDNLAQYLHSGADKIGIAPEDLIQEFKSDPSGAAELIYLASEIRKGPQDDKILTNVLVEYIERLGSKIALDDSKSGGLETRDQLKAVITRVESEIVRKLKTKEINDDVLADVQQKLAERMEMCFNKLKSEWEQQQKGSFQNKNIGESAIISILEDSVEEGEELHDILQQVRASINAGDIDENNFQQIYEEISKLRQADSNKKEEAPFPESILNFKHTKLFIEKEIYRSLRYDTPFSLITFSIEKVIPQRPVPTGTVNGYEINRSILSQIARILRQPDLVGILNKKIMVVLLPMTEENNAKIALRRILRKLHAKPFVIKDIPFTVQFAGAATFFDYERTADLDSFIKTAEREHNDFLIRLKNVQNLF